MFVSSCKTKKQHERKATPSANRKTRFSCAQVKGNFHIEHGEEHLTSYAGLELVRRFLRLLRFSSLLRRLERRVKIGGDLRLSSAVLLFLGMLLVGGRRLRHTWLLT
jgi:hypothetical protein